jgi:hypothetical protein
MKPESSIFMSEVCGLQVVTSLITIGISNFCPTSFIELYGIEEFDGLHRGSTGDAVKLVDQHGYGSMSGYWLEGTRSIKGSQFPQKNKTVPTVFHFNIALSYFTKLFHLLANFKRQDDF